MKTTKRSKMLVSSIAMLLVALVALGSATYAWYSINRTVTAKKTEITASTPGGLQISKTSASDGFGAEVDLDAMVETLEPAALAFAKGDTGITITPTYYDGTDKDNGALTGTVKTAVNGVKYYVQDEIWLKNTNSVKGAITCTATASAKGENSTLSDSYSCIALVDEEGAVKYVAKSAGTTTVTGAVDSATASSTLTTLNPAGATVQHYYVVAWVDGYNTNCTNTKSATAGTVSWELAFSMTDAA